MSIVLLAILAVMWAAFLLPVIVPNRRAQPKASRLAGAASMGWRPRPDPPAAAPARRRLARRHAVLRRRRVLLALVVTVLAAARAWFVLGGVWWIALAATGSLLLAYLVALVAYGWRWHRASSRHRAVVPQNRPASVAPEPRGGRAGAALLARLCRGSRREQAELPLWGGPLLESQAPAPPE